MPGKWCGSAMEGLMKCEWNANSQQPTTTATDLPLLTPQLSTVGWSKTARFTNLRRKGSPFWKILSSQATIRNTFFDQRSPWHLEVGVSQRQEHTDRHCNLMTVMAKRAESVKTKHMHFCTSSVGFLYIVGQHTITGFAKPCKQDNKVKDQLHGQ